MATGEKPMSGNGAFAGFSGQRRAGFAETARTAPSLSSYVKPTGFAAAAKAAEAIREQEESKPVSTKKTKAKKKYEAEQVPSEGYGNLHVTESGPRRVADTLRRGFVRSTPASFDVSRRFNRTREATAEWGQFARRLEARNGHNFRVLPVAAYALTYITGEEMDPLITKRLEKARSGNQPKNAKWEMDQIHNMVDVLNDALRREMGRELDADALFAFEHAPFVNDAVERQHDPEHPRYVEMAIERADGADLPFMDMPLQQWQDDLFDVAPGFTGVRHDAYSLEAVDALDRLKGGRSRLLDIMGDVCGLDVSMVDPDWNPSIIVMETYDGRPWHGKSPLIPAVPMQVPLRAPQAYNCEV